MGFWSLFEVASMPIVQVLLLSLLGALMATNYLNLLPADARNSLNKIVFMVFTPCLMFANLAETVTFKDLVAWWFMPINVGLTFLFGGILGWIAVKLLKPKPHLEGLIIATCASGNLGNLLLIIIPAICSEDGSPFGDHDVCSTMGLSYASYSMALGGLYIWTFSYQLVRSSAMKYKALEAAEEVSKIVGFFFGAIPWLKNLIIGDTAPLRVIQDSIKLLGEGTIPCITLILGGNLTQGLRTGRLKPITIIAVILVRYVLLPVIGIGVVKAADSLGFLPSDPLYRYVLLIQFALPPAMNIGTMAQLFDVAQEECSLLLMWTYLVACLSLTAWSTIFMWILS